MGDKKRGSKRFRFHSNNDEGPTKNWETVEDELEYFYYDLFYDKHNKSWVLDILKETKNTYQQWNSLLTNSPINRLYCHSLFSCHKANSKSIEKITFLLHNWADLQKKCKNRDLDTLQWIRKYLNIKFKIAEIPPTTTGKLPWLSYNHTSINKKVAYNKDDFVTIGITNCVDDIPF